MSNAVGEVSFRRFLVPSLFIAVLTGCASYAPNSSIMVLSPL